MESLNEPLLENQESKVDKGVDYIGEVNTMIREKNQDALNVENVFKKVAGSYRKLRNGTEVTKHSKPSLITATNNLIYYDENLDSYQFYSCLANNTITLENFPERRASHIYSPPLGSRIFFALSRGVLESRNPLDLSLMETINFE